jgi:hypothetical protein
MPTIPAWHERCILREDVRSGRLELSEFAAKLNLVRQQRAPHIYQNPDAFLSRTYSSRQLKLLVRQITRRLSDLPDGKPVVRMQVSYGGGKTHTLITLLHLAEQGASISEHPTTQTFLTFADMTHLPRARVALLPCDDFGYQSGLVVYDPDGHTRTAYTLWGALAYQLGGDLGLAMVNDDPDAFIAPGEERLAELLTLPQRRDGSGTLILIDETLMYCRDAYNHRTSTLGTLKDFFQRLTQAVARTPKAALVASLVSSETEKHDATGLIILQELEAVFSRLEENIEPVGRDDLPEVLRRRFFEQVPSVEQRQPIINAILAALQTVPVRDSQKDADAERRFLDAYPFHPELLDVLTQKWTQLPNYQRTRGALRLLGLALQHAADHDPSPLIAPGAFLNYSSEPANLSPALTELVKATGDQDSWRPLLEGEDARARAAHAQFPALHHRELEQAVIATFLHSQPRGKRAETADLLGLLAYSGPDQLSLTDGLKDWRGRSWFLVEGDDHFWQLDLTSNLNKMHAEAMEHVSASEISNEIKQRARDNKTLTKTTDGVRPYNLPGSPRDVEDTAEFRYLVLGPECAVTPGQPVSAEVAAFFSTVSGPNNPRTYKNALVALAPDSNNLSGLRNQVKRWLAWRLVGGSPEAARLSDAQKKKLANEIQTLSNTLPTSVQGAWSVLVATDDSGALKAELLKPIAGNQNATPFERIVAMLRESERLAPEKIDPVLLLPGEYLNLWRPDQTSLSVDTLVNSFGQFTRLPRIMRRAVLEASLRQGVLDGTLALRMVRSDNSVRTIWRQTPSDDDLRRQELEIVPIAHATLTSLDANLLRPGALPNLWPALPTGGLALAQISAYFDGRHAPQLESQTILTQAIRAAVKDGLLMAQTANDAWCRESLPPDLALDGALLVPPPQAIPPGELGEKNLPDAWSTGRTTVGQIMEALTAKKGAPVPWPALRDALIAGSRQNLFLVDVDLLVTAPAAERVAIPLHPRPITTLDPNVFTEPSVVALLQGGKTRLRDIKPVIERSRGVTIPDDVFIRAAKQAASEGKITLPDGYMTLNGEAFLHLIVYPKKIRIAGEASLNLKALSDLPQAAKTLKEIAPEMNFEFQITISAEGEVLTTEQLNQLNELLATVSPHLRLS